MLASATDQLVGIVGGGSRATRSTRAQGPYMTETTSPHRLSLIRQPPDTSVPIDRKKSSASSAWPKSASASPPQLRSVITSKPPAPERQIIHHVATAGPFSDLFCPPCTVRPVVPSLDNPFLLNCLRYRPQTSF